MYQLSGCLATCYDRYSFLKGAIIIYGSDGTSDCNEYLAFTLSGFNKKGTLFDVGQHDTHIGYVMRSLISIQLKASRSMDQKGQQHGPFWFPRRPWEPGMGAGISFFAPSVDKTSCEQV
jgi:hypothetical protein